MEERVRTQRLDAAVVLAELVWLWGPAGGRDMSRVDPPSARMLGWAPCRSPVYRRFLPLFQRTGILFWDQENRAFKRRMLGVGAAFACAADERPSTPKQGGFLPVDVIGFPWS